MCASPRPPVPLLVACLCADWCTTCRDYQELFERASDDFEPAAAFVWIDIEDHADVLGEIDVDTFPTLLIARGDALLFFGPLTPHAAVLTRTLDKALAGGFNPIVDARLAELLVRVRSASETGLAR